MRRSKIFLVVAVQMFMWCFLNLAHAADFPARKDYPTVPPISTAELNAKQEAGKVVIVDVRSKIEYDVIHPAGAVHIPMSHVSFLEKVDELTKENPDKAIAFYCNGVTCLKSYEATQKAVDAGYVNCFVYDAGIPEWAKTFPQKTILLGRTIADAEKQLISDSEFKKKCLNFKEFKVKANSSNTMLIDVRDYIQKSGDIPELGLALPIPLDKFIPNFVSRKFNKDKILLIFDQVGKQVRWLEYYLKDNGYTDYFFLKGGATAVLQTQDYK